jgi:DNA-binding beta-propeller fold protein YncE
MRETHLRALFKRAVSADGWLRRRRRRAESTVASIASVAVAAVSLASGTLGHAHNQSLVGHSGGPPRMAYALTLSGAVVPVNLTTMKAGRPLQSGLKGFGTIPENSNAVLAAGGRTLYVSTKAGRILLISTKTGKIERAITVAGSPEGADQLLAGANGKIAYAQGHGTITPIDLVTGIALRPVSVSGASQAFGWVAVSGNGKTFLTAGLREVTVVTSDRARKPIKLKNPLSVTCVGVSPDGATGFVLRRSLKGRYYVLPIDVATDKALRPIQLRSQNYGVLTGLCTVAVAPNGRAAYVQIGRYVVPIDLVTRRALRPIKLPPLSADFTPQLSIDPAGSMAYALGAHWAFPIDLATHKALPAVSFSVDFDGFCLAFSPNGGTVLAGVGGAHNAGKLLLIRTATGKTFKTIRLPGVPVSIAAAP